MDEAQKTVAELEEKLMVLEAQDAEDKKNSGKEIRIWMDGAFDMMHYGHMNAFRQARALGTYLIAGINSDASITVCKGQPVMNDEVKILSIQTNSKLSMNVFIMELLKKIINNYIYLLTFTIYTIYLYIFIHIGT